MVQVDITETVKQLVLAVQRLCQRANFTQRNFTVNHLVEIWRGMKSQKVPYTLTHGLINFVDTKAKCRHLKKLT
jgi:hypothetical protein